MSTAASLWPLWLGAIALLLLALAGLLWPLLHDPAEAEIAADAGAGPDAAALARLRALYRTKRDELDRDVRLRTLDPAERERALEDLQRRLLDDVDRTHAAAPRRAADGPWLRRAPAALLSILLPLAALGLYLQAGDPRAAATLALAMPGQHEREGVDVDAMVERLAARLQREPDDLQGWMVLARSREVQEDFDAATQAYRTAITLADRQQQPAELRAKQRADLADALASSRGGALDGPVQAVLDEALALDPDQPKALALAGTAAWRRGDLDGARRSWQRLLHRLDPDSDVAMRVRSDLARLDEAAPGPPPAQAGTAPAP